MPFGAEDEARAFYTDVLGFQEIEKPESLQANGGLSINKHAGERTIPFSRVFYDECSSKLATGTLCF